MGLVREEVIESTGGSIRESVRSTNRIKESGREEWNNNKQTNIEGVIDGVGEGGGDWVHWRIHEGVNQIYKQNQGEWQRKVK